MNLAVLARAILALFRGRTGIPAPLTQEEKNEQAWIVVVSACEGTNYPDGYTYLFGSSPKNDLRFKGFDTHPNIKRPYTDLSGKTFFSTAAGRFQIIFSTYKLHGGGRFDPPAQDAMCLSITRKAGALEDVRAGRLRDAVRKCGTQWASLPSSNYAQPKRGWMFVEKTFADAGGVQTDL